MITTDEIKSILASLGGRQAALATEVGVTQPTVSRWLNGAMPDPEAEFRLRELQTRLGDASFRPPPQFLGERNLPVYSAVEGGPGEIVVSTDPIEMVPRPWYLGQVKEGYAVLVVGESMAPAFEPGDMAIVNPRLPPVRGKTHIFTNEPDDGSFTATIKRLVGQSTSEWKVEQFNPKKEFGLKRSDWSKALRVVGRYEGG